MPKSKRMTWYNFEPETQTKKEYLAKVKYDKIVAERAREFDKIIDGGLEENTQYRLITEKSFNAISIIESIAAKWAFEEVYIAVYRMNLQSVRKIKEFIEDTGVHCVILLSNFFRENKKYEKWCRDLVEYSRSRENCKVFFTNSHAKVFLSKTRCGKHIVFEGSGNLSDNARIEQYILEDNEHIYNFHKKWIDDVANEKQ